MPIVVFLSRSISDIPRPEPPPTILSDSCHIDTGQYTPSDGDEVITCWGDDDDMVRVIMIIWWG